MLIWDIRDMALSLETQGDSGLNRFSVLKLGPWEAAPFVGSLTHTPAAQRGNK
jgi:hypothetical protein